MGKQKYTFDRIFDSDSTQKQVFDDAIEPVVQSVMEGFNGTVLAYGQTGSGKTHTMLGPTMDDEIERGVIPRMVSQVFELIGMSDESIEFSVKVSMIEIYREKIRDLIEPSKTNLQIHEDKNKAIYVADVTETYVTDEIEVYDLMKIGNANRAIGVTDMNSQSSRSHSCFILTLQMNNTIDFSQKTGKLYLVDLAGSEKIAKTGAQGMTLKEAQNIN